METEQNSKGYSRRDYVICRVKKSEMKKLRHWLDSQPRTQVDVATYQELGQVYLFKRA